MYMLHCNLEKTHIRVTVITREDWRHVCIRGRQCVVRVWWEVMCYVRLTRQWRMNWRSNEQTDKCNEEQNWCSDELRSHLVIWNDHWGYPLIRIWWMTYQFLLENKSVIWHKEQVPSTTGISWGRISTIRTFRTWLQQKIVALGQHILRPL